MIWEVSANKCIDSDAYNKGGCVMGDLKYIPFEEESEDIKPKVTEYWTQRADSFFIQKQHELESDKSLKWKREIIQKISEAYGDYRELNILDVGCGVGFFTVLLGKEGYNVTGIDLTEYMIEKAGMMIAYNGPYRGTVTAMTMDAENLLFEDGFFDVVVTRNLTWTLPDPIKAYNEWARVLKKGGVLLNFDAEYAKGAHLFDAKENPAHKCVSEDLKDKCHDIYHMLTISSLERPKWDIRLLDELGFSKTSADLNFYRRIFEQKDEFYIPDRMFMISAVK